MEFSLLIRLLNVEINQLNNFYMEIRLLNIW